MRGEVRAEALVDCIRVRICLLYTSILAALVRIEARVIAGGGQTAAEQQIADLLLSLIHI